MFPFTINVILFILFLNLLKTLITGPSRNLFQIHHREWFTKELYRQRTDKHDVNVKTEGQSVENLLESLRVLRLTVVVLFVGLVPLMLKGF